MEDRWSRMLQSLTTIKSTNRSKGVIKPEIDGSKNANIKNYVSLNNCKFIKVFFKKADKHSDRKHGETVYKVISHLIGHINAIGKQTLDCPLITFWFVVASLFTAFAIKRYTKKPTRANQALVSR